MSDGRVEQSWYGELYAIHKLKVAAARFAVLRAQNIDLSVVDDALTEFEQALYECRSLGLTDEILLERLKV